LLDDGAVLGRVGRISIDHANGQSRALEVVGRGRFFFAGYVWN
jgi:hypothetical protein